MQISTIENHGFPLPMFADYFSIFGAMLQTECGKPLAKIQPTRRL